MKSEDQDEHDQRIDQVLRELEDREFFVLEIRRKKSPVSSCGQIVNDRDAADQPDALTEVGLTAFFHEEVQDPSPQYPESKGETHGVKDMKRRVKGEAHIDKFFRRGGDNVDRDEKTCKDGHQERAAEKYQGILRSFLAGLIRLSGA